MAAMPGVRDYHRFMSDEPAAVALSRGRFRLVLGSDVGITAMEVVANGDQTRLDLNDLRGTNRRLDLPRDDSNRSEALFIIGSPTDASEALEGEVVVDTFGADDSKLTVRIRKSEPSVLKGVLAEAAFAAWRQRLADAADSLAQLTSADARIIGQLNVPGRPLLTELRAERRRVLYSPTAVADLPDDVGAAVDELIVDLRAAVRFGAAGLAEVGDGHLDESINTACNEGGWIDRLRLLIAADEISAIELFAAAAAWLVSGPANDSDSEAIDRLLAKYVSQRQQAEELAMLLDEVSGRLPTAPGNPAKRLVKRKSLRDVEKVRETAGAYAGVVNGATSSQGDATTWDDAARTLFELDIITALESSDDPRFNQEASQSVEDAATALGELFAQQLPAARTLVDDLARQHAGVDAEGQVQMVKRQAVRKLGSASRRDNTGPPLPETVAELAMAIALLRGIEPHTEAEFEETGRRILARAQKIGNLHLRAGAAVPQAFAGFEVFARYVQPAIAEFVFQAMGGLKPGRPGMARDVYKTMRSNVWRARHNRGITEAATGGASAALTKAMDAAAPRLIVRYVDRSLPSPKR